MSLRKHTKTYQVAKPVKSLTQTQCGARVPYSNVKYSDSEGRDNPITVNLQHCKYPVVYEVVEDVMKWKVTRNPKDPWDLLWSDVVREVYFPGSKYRKH